MSTTNGRDLGLQKPHTGSDDGLSFDAGPLLDHDITTEDQFADALERVVESHFQGTANELAYRIEKRAFHSAKRRYEELKADLTQLVMTAAQSESLDEALLAVFEVETLAPNLVRAALAIRGQSQNKAHEHRLLAGVNGFINSQLQKLDNLIPTEGTLLENQQDPLPSWPAPCAGPSSDATGDAAEDPLPDNVEKVTRVQYRWADSKRYLTKDEKAQLIDNPPAPQASDDAVS